LSCFFSPTNPLIFYCNSGTDEPTEIKTALYLDVGDDPKENFKTFFMGRKEDTEKLILRVHIKEIPNLKKTRIKNLEEGWLLEL